VKQPLTANHINYCARGSSETPSDCLKRKIVFGEPETLTHGKPSITLHSLCSAKLLTCTYTNTHTRV